MKKWTADQYVCQQGELTIVNLDRAPAAVVAKLEMASQADDGKRDRQGRAIVGHSETGHHHVLTDPSAEFHESTSPFICYLSLETPARLEHLRNDHQHTAWQLPAGRYWVSRQREGGPQRWRMARD